MDSNGHKRKTDRRKVLHFPANKLIALSLARRFWHGEEIYRIAKSERVRMHVVKDAIRQTQSFPVRKAA